MSTLFFAMKWAATPNLFALVRFMSWFMSFDRASNVEIGVECQIFVIVIFLTAAKCYNLGDILGKYEKGVLTQKRSFLGICTTFRSAFHVS